MPQKIPATVITGFLGAGKTTLIRNLLATANGKRIQALETRLGARLLNRTTRESYLVSDEPNPQGWRLVEIYPSDELGRVEAKISAGPGQVVSVRFDEKQLKPEENKPTRPATKQPAQSNRSGGGERRGHRAPRHFRSLGPPGHRG